MKRTLLFVVVQMISLSVFAQDIIKGTVTDKAGDPLPGVNVVIDGTTNGTVTNFDGQYQLAGVSEDAVLKFSFIGYLSKKVEVGSRSSIDVVLDEDVETLDEVVVVGYGVQKKASLTGSVAEVGGESLVQVAAPSLDQALQGRVSGVNVTSNTGAPGEGVSVRIRGVGSLNSNNDPLYIVDGVPTKDAFNTLSPQDIESVSVLKDAASSAIYGSRANNGVILITTKKGKSGKMNISFSGETGVQRPSNKLDMANKDEYVEVYNEAAMNDNAQIADPLFHRDLISPEYAATLPDVDYQDEIYQAGIIQNYNMTVSGGNDKTTYSIGGNYYDQEGIVIGSDYQKFNSRFNLQTKLSDKVKVGVNFNVLSSSTDIVSSSGDGYSGGGGSVVRYALFRTPGIPVYDENGNYVDMPDNPQFWGDGYNPVGVAMNANNNKKINQYFGDVNLGWSVTDDIFFNTKLGVDNSSYNQRIFDMTWGTNNRINNPNALTVMDGRNITLSWSNTLSYDKSWGDHNFNAMAGTEAIDYSGYDNQGMQKNFADQDPSLVYLGNGNGQTQVYESSYGYSLMSFFGRVNYDYDNKYLFSATIREDGSSRFAQGNQWGTFYSVSGGWRIDKEAFMDNVDQIDMLKLRVGYGKIGNQDVGYYAYSDQYGINYNYPFGNYSRDGYAMTVLGNSEVTWETSNQLDIGLDFEAFKGKFHGSVDYFHKVTSDMLTKETIPPSNGYSDPAWVNNGSILNTGVEIELGYQESFGEFNLFIDGNVAFLHNEVLELGNPIYAGRIDNGVYATKTEVGQPVGSFYLYEMDGIFQNEYEVMTSAYQGENVYPGDVKYVDQNGDGVIDEEDRVHCGSAIPTVTYGLNIAATYRNWDFSMFFQGAAGQDIYYQVATDIEGFYRPFNVTQRYYDERWTGEGTSNTQPRASWSSKSNNTLPSTRFLEDGDYLRLKNIQIGYTFKSEKINRARIYLSANNVWTWTKYAGIDPEMTVSQNSRSEGDMAAGIDWGTYPTASSLLIGLQLNF